MRKKRIKHRITPMFNLRFPILHDFWSSLTINDPDFPEIFLNYEEYHKRVEFLSSVCLQRAQLVADWIESGSTILDVGVGDGTFADYIIKTRGARVTGIDVSSYAAHTVSKKLGIETIVRDVDTGLGLTTSFDYITFIEVIEHLKFPHRALLDAIKHARKGVIVTIPNVGYISWRIQLLRGYFPRHSFSHLHYWSLRDFILFCNKLNISIIDFKATLLSKPDSLLARSFPNLFADQLCFLLKGTSNDSTKN